MYLSTGVGGVIGCIFAGLMTQYYHPKWCFFWYSWMGILVTLFAFRLTKDSEKNFIQDIGSNISSSQEDYEYGVRAERIRDGARTLEEARKPIDKRDGFCFNLKKNL